MSGGPDDENLTPTTPSRPVRPRRASLVELFASRPSNASDSGAGFGSAFDPDQSQPKAGNAMAQAMQQQSHTRRLSLTTLGLSGSPTHTNQTSPFQPLRDRSMGSISDNSRRPSSTDELEESAVDDTEPVGPMNGSKTNPSSPGLGRRVSFGARAYSGMRASSGGGTSPGSGSGGSSGTGAGETGTKTQSPPTPGTRFREGFNWSESLKNRAQRTSVSGGSVQGNAFLPLTSTGHGRTKSGASPSDPVAPPVAPKPPPKAPDHFQERILKGDFYMD